MKTIMLYSYVLVKKRSQIEKAAVKRSRRISCG